MHDVRVLDLLQSEPSAFYVMDRGHLELERLAQLDGGGAFFVTQAKSNTQLRRRYSGPVDRSISRCFAVLPSTSPSWNPQTAP